MNAALKPTLGGALRDQVLNDLMGQAGSKGFYGKLVLMYENGEIVRVLKEQSIKF